MENKKEILTVCVSVEELFNMGRDMNNLDLSIHHEKDGEQEWFDLIENAMGVVCMDGESCDVVEATDEYATFRNKEGEYDTEFSLYGNDVKVATGYTLKELQKRIFKELVKSILDNGNTVTFAINDPDNEGLTVNEWTKLVENDSEIIDTWVDEETVLIDEDAAWEIVRGLGIIYPVIYDESTGEQIQ